MLSRERTISVLAGMVLFAVLLGVASYLWGGDVLLGALFGAAFAVFTHWLAGNLAGDGRLTPGEIVGFGLFCLILTTALYLFWFDDATVLSIALLAGTLWGGTLLMASLRMRLERPAVIAKVGEAREEAARKRNPMR